MLEMFSQGSHQSGDTMTSQNHITTAAAEQILAFHGLTISITEINSKMGDRQDALNDPHSIERESCTTSMMNRSQIREEAERLNRTFYLQNIL